MESETSRSGLISQLEGWIGHAQHHPPGLYLVATPIGNLADITLRALYILSAADIVLCEDTRVTRKLLAAYGITAQTLAYHAHNAGKMQPVILDHLASGKRVALVSDAGTPMISDPGFAIARAAQEAGHYVTSLPGASSVVTALTLSGLPAEPFFFAGFLPSKKQAREKAAAELASLPATLVLLEAPHRLADSLASLASVLGDRPAAIARELTKRHEEVKRGNLAELADYYANHGNPKGEIVLVIAPAETTPATAEDLDSLLKTALLGQSVKEASADIAEATGLPRKEVYRRALELKGGGV